MSARMRPRRDHRWLVAVAALAAITLGGAAVHRLTREPAAASPAGGAEAHVRQMQQAEFDTGFKQAVVMLHAHQYEHAVTALHRLLQIAPEVPEVHVNMGFALLGLQRFDAARDFFTGATGLAPMQSNAYYGLAMAYEGLGDLPAALGAMRTFVHLAARDDPWLPKARAALWEWQSRAPR